jgi:DNA uptake protein ComE-like DNA-binding protein
LLILLSELLYLTFVNYFGHREGFLSNDISKDSIEFNQDKSNLFLSRLDSSETVQLIKYFKFNPNKLQYSYWRYFGLDQNQLYSLDSFRVEKKFSSFEQVQKILKLDSNQVKLFDSLIYFNKPKNKSPYQNRSSNQSRQWSGKSSFYSAYSKPDYFKFDPNKIDHKTWQKLGFSPKQSSLIINRIKNIRGVKKVEDMLKLVVIDSSNFEKIRPYVTIDKSFVDSVYPAKIDINRAKIVDLKQVNGVGDSLAKRIILYRDALGGIVQMWQLKEVNMLDSIVNIELRKLFYVDKSFVPNKIDINNDDLDKLNNHPYINYRLAKSIVDFRTNFRKFSSLQELRQITELSEARFNKINLYLEPLNNKVPQ